MISQRTSAGLQAAKERGVKLGNQAQADANKAAAAGSRRYPETNFERADRQLDARHRTGANQPRDCHPERRQELEPDDRAAGDAAARPNRLTRKSGL